MISGVNLKDIVNKLRLGVILRINLGSSMFYNKRCSYFKIEYGNLYRFIFPTFPYWEELDMEFYSYENMFAWSSYRSYDIIIPKGLK